MKVFAPNLGEGRGNPLSLSVEAKVSRSKPKPFVVSMDVGELIPRGAMSILKFCLVGRWKDLLDQTPLIEEMEEWVVTMWRLKGGMMMIRLP